MLHEVYIGPVLEDLSYFVPHIFRFWQEFQTLKDVKETRILHVHDVTTPRYLSVDRPPRSLNGHQAYDMKLSLYDFTA